MGVAFWYRGPGYIAASFGLAQSPGPVANLAPMAPFSTFSDSWRCHADARQFFFSSSSSSSSFIWALLFSGFRTGSVQVLSDHFR